MPLESTPRGGRCRVAVPLGCASWYWREKASVKGKTKPLPKVPFGDVVLVELRVAKNQDLFYDANMKGLFLCVCECVCSLKPDVKSTVVLAGFLGCRGKLGNWSPDHLFPLPEIDGFVGLRSTHGRNQVLISLMWVDPNLAVNFTERLC